MSLSSAMSAAVSGLTASGRGLQVVSDNIANALTDGYGARRIELESNQFGGTRITGIQRLTDPALTANRRQSDADLAAAEQHAAFATRLEQLYGAVDEPGSISGTLNQFKADLITAASTPESTQRLTIAAQSAKDLVAAINTAATGISDLRQRADTRIATEVEALNSDLQRVQRLNRQIVQTEASGNDASGLYDQRQQTLDRINEIVPVRVLPRDNNQVALVSQKGAILLDGKAAEIGFVPATYITPDLSLGAGDLSGLTLNGSAQPSERGGPLGGGRLGAAFDIRDRKAPDAQADLDSFARSLIERFDPASATPGAGVFTDVTGPFDPMDEVGIANRLRLDTRLDPDGAPEVWRLRDGLDAGSPGPVGDPGGLTDMIDWLDAREVPSNPGLSTTALSAVQFASGLSSRASLERVDAERSLSHATVSKAELERIEQENGVDTDTELQSLIAIEQAYAANARVLTTIDEMLQLLTRI